MLPFFVLLPLPPSELPAPLDLSLGAWLVQDAPPPAEEPAEEEPKLDVWTGTISAGLTLTRGNSESTTVAATADAKRESLKDRWTTGAWYNKSEQEFPDDPVTPVDEGTTEETVDNYGGKLQYDRFITEKLYWLANAKGESDDFAGLQFRGTVGVGLGYQFWDTESFDLNGEAGLNWVHEDLEGESPNEFLAARLATNWEYLWTETTKLGQTAEVYPSLEDSDDWTSRIDTHADVSMTEAMFLRVQHVLDYDNSPAEDKQPADNRVLVTVGWSF